MVKPANGFKHFTIPVFIPGIGCNFRCIYCDQQKISGTSGLPSSEKVLETMHTHLSTIPEDNTEIEVGFFGGTFTGLSAEQQQRYFDAIRPFIESGRIRSIRISTRPDFITPEILALLRKNHVRTIELGAQSMDDEVLKLSCRGHSSRDTENASRMITGEGFVLGLQMMIGLPGDTEEKAIRTAEKIIGLSASETRIYPALVISGTELEKLFLSGNYTPLELDEAIRRTKKIVTLFDSAAVRILRIGLHPSEELMNKDSLVAGPFHPSLRELVLTELWYDRFLNDSFLPGHRGIHIHVNPADYNNAVGYSGKNRKHFRKHYSEVRFIADPDIPVKEYHADYR